MLVVMQAGATTRQVEDVCGAIRAMGFEPVPMPGAQRTAVGLIGNDGQVDGSHIAGMDGVAQVLYVSKPYKQVSREWRPENTVVEVAPGVRFGGPEVPVIAGPCSVESEAQILASAHAVKAAGAVALRGGAYKPRSSPYAFQGLGRAGLELLAKAREAPARHRHRGARRGGRARGGRVRRRGADRRAQHAELHAAQARRAARPAGAAQARHGRRPSRSCCSPPSTCSPRGTPT
jgi:hypothetical protein